jgi:hypothetical protein
VREPPEEPPGTEVPGASPAERPERARQDDPATPDLDLADVNRVVTSDEEGTDEGTPPREPPPPAH